MDRMRHMGPNVAGQAANYQPMTSPGCYPGGGGTYQGSSDGYQQTMTGSYNPVGAQQNLRDSMCYKQGMMGYQQQQPQPQQGGMRFLGLSTKNIVYQNLPGGEIVQTANQQKPPGPGYDGGGHRQMQPGPVGYAGYDAQGYVGQTGFPVEAQDYPGPLQGGQMHMQVQGQFQGSMMVSPGEETTMAPQGGAAGGGVVWFAGGGGGGGQEEGFPTGSSGTMNIQMQMMSSQRVPYPGAQQAMIRMPGPRMINTMDVVPGRSVKRSVRMGNPRHAVTSFPPSRVAQPQSSPSSSSSYGPTGPHFAHHHQQQILLQQQQQQQQQQPHPAQMQQFYPQHLQNELLQPFGGSRSQFYEAPNSTTFSARVSSAEQVNVQHHSQSEPSFSPMASPVGRMNMNMGLPNQPMVVAQCGRNFRMQVPVGPPTSPGGQGQMQSPPLMSPNSQMQHCRTAMLASAGSSTQSDPGGCAHDPSASASFHSQAHAMVPVGCGGSVGHPSPSHSHSSLGRGSCDSANVYGEASPAPRYDPALNAFPNSLARNVAVAPGPGRLSHPLGHSSHSQTSQEEFAMSTASTNISSSLSCATCATFSSTSTTSSPNSCDTSVTMATTLHELLGKGKQSGHHLADNNQSGTKLALSHAVTLAMTVGAETVSMVTSTVTMAPCSSPRRQSVHSLPSLFTNIASSHRLAAPSDPTTTNVTFSSSSAITSALMSIQHSLASTRTPCKETATEGVKNGGQAGSTSSLHPQQSCPAVSLPSFGSLMGGVSSDVCVTVPFGWRRVQEATAIVYYSPSDAKLSSLPAVRQYLSTEGTCKCGLGCPLLVERVFSFNPQVPSKPWCPEEVDTNDDLTKLCNHRRKIVAMATLKNSAGIHQRLQDRDSASVAGSSCTPNSHESLALNKKEGMSSKKKKGKSKSSPGPYDGMLVSQLLKQRDRMSESSNLNKQSSAASLLMDASSHLAAAKARAGEARGMSAGAGMPGCGPVQRPLDAATAHAMAMNDGMGQQTELESSFAGRQMDMAGFPHGAGHEMSNMDNMLLSPEQQMRFKQQQHQQELMSCSQRPFSGLMQPRDMAAGSRRGPRNINPFEMFTRFRGGMSHAGPQACGQFFMPRGQMNMTGAQPQPQPQPRQQALFRFNSPLHGSPVMQGPASSPPYHIGTSATANPPHQMHNNMSPMMQSHAGGAHLDHDVMQMNNVQQSQSHRHQVCGHVEADNNVQEDSCVAQEPNPKSHNCVVEDVTMTATNDSSTSATTTTTTTATITRTDQLEAPKLRKKKKKKKKKKSARLLSEALIDSRGMSCPNVDVRNMVSMSNNRLFGGGKKALPSMSAVSSSGASFFDNPTAFLAQQSKVVNSSLQLNHCSCDLSSADVSAISHSSAGDASISSARGCVGATLQQSCATPGSTTSRFLAAALESDIAGGTRSKSEPSAADSEHSNSGQSGLGGGRVPDTKLTNVEQFTSGPSSVTNEKYHNGIVLSANQSENSDSAPDSKLLVTASFPSQGKDEPSRSTCRFSSADDACQKTKSSDGFGSTQQAAMISPSMHGAAHVLHAVETRENSHGGTCSELNPATSFHPDRQTPDAGSDARFPSPSFQPIFNAKQAKDFPASSLLSAAARAQVGGKQSGSMRDGATGSGQQTPVGHLLHLSKMMQQQQKKPKQRLQQQQQQQQSVLTTAPASTSFLQCGEAPNVNHQAFFSQTSPNGLPYAGAPGGGGIVLTNTGASSRGASIGHQFVGVSPAGTVMLASGPGKMEGRGDSRATLATNPQGAMQLQMEGVNGDMGSSVSMLSLPQQQQQQQQQQAVQGLLQTTSGRSHKQSPIQMVQNMISGLEVEAAHHNPFIATGTPMGLAGGMELKQQGQHMLMDVHGHQFLEQDMMGQSIVVDGSLLQQAGCAMSPSTGALGPHMMAEAALHNGDECDDHSMALRKVLANPTMTVNVNVSQGISPGTVSVMSGTVPVASYSMAMPPMSMTAVTGVTNAITQVIPTVGLQQQIAHPIIATAQQPLMQVMNPVGISMQNGTFILTNPQITGDIHAANQQQQMVIVSQNQGTGLLEYQTPHQGVVLTTGAQETEDCTAGGMLEQAEEGLDEAASHCAQDPQSGLAHQEEAGDDEAAEASAEMELEKREGVDDSVGYEAATDFETPTDKQYAAGVDSTVASDDLQAAALLAPPTDKNGLKKVKGKKKKKKKKLKKKLHCSAAVYSELPVSAVKDDVIINAGSELTDGQLDEGSKLTDCPQELLQGSPDQTLEKDEVLGENMEQLAAGEEGGQVCVLSQQQEQQFFLSPGPVMAQGQLNVIQVQGHVQSEAESDEQYNQMCLSQMHCQTETNFLQSLNVIPVGVDPATLQNVQLTNTIIGQHISAHGTQFISAQNFQAAENGMVLQGLQGFPSQAMVQPLMPILHGSVATVAGENGVSLVQVSQPHYEAVSSEEAHNQAALLDSQALLEAEGYQLTGQVTTHGVFTGDEEDMVSLDQSSTIPDQTSAIKYSLHADTDDVDPESMTSQTVSPPGECLQQHHLLCVDEESGSAQSYCDTNTNPPVQTLSSEEKNYDKKVGGSKREVATVRPMEPHMFIHDKNIASPEDGSKLPNPSNLTEAVRAVVKSQQVHVFGDQSPQHPVRKTVFSKATRGRRRRLGGRKFTHRHIFPRQTQILGVALKTSTEWQGKESILCNSDITNIVKENGLVPKGKEVKVVTPPKYSRRAAEVHGSNNNKDISDQNTSTDSNVAPSAEDLPLTHNASKNSSFSEEANHTSDSSTSATVSEGDDARRGNSPVIKCSGISVLSPSDVTDSSSPLMEGGASPGDKTSASESRMVAVLGGHSDVSLTTASRYHGDNLLEIHRGVKRSLEEDMYNDDDDADSTASSDFPVSVYPRTFNVGDLVWGQIRGFPSWPGKLMHESDIKGNHSKTEDGKLWVRWFGDHTFTQVEPEKLKTLSEGLEAHHRARKKHRKGRKLNTNLEAAINEAFAELDRQTVEQQKPASPPAVASPPSIGDAPAPATDLSPVTVTKVVNNKMKGFKKRKGR